MIGVPCSAPPPPRPPPPGSQMLPPTAAAAASLSAAPSPAASPPKICFNYNCKEPKSEVPCKKGWRLRSGEHADLCNRCSCTYEQGMFCETFHVNIGGWRNCESCGKRIHCGCIVSAPSYMLLDAGGIECVSCAKKAVLMAPKQQMWPSPSLHPVQVSERPKEFSAKARNQTGPFLGQWRQASNLWNVASAQSELHQRLAYEFDRPSITEKLFAAGRPLISPQEKKVEDLSVRTVPSGPKNAIRERFAKGTSCLDSLSAFNSCSGEEGKTDCMQDSGHLSGENDRVFTAKGLISDPCSTGSRVNFETHPNSCINLRQSSFPKEDSTSPVVGLTAPFAAPNEPNDSARTSTSQPNKQTAPSSVNQIHLSSENIIDLSGEPQAHMQNGRSRGDTRPQAQLLPRNWPRTTDEEIHRISREYPLQFFDFALQPKYEITPLFEKTLSASDAGRIGRLVLPKKCAEAYFPRITHPEGLPLKVQDATGNEWVLQFRFWPNNNSRMYVLEGVTSCIQSMQLQAGDTVTFSRKDPEGKLVMGCKKASDMPPLQDNQSLKSGNGVETPPNVNGIITAADYVPNLPPLPLKSSTESRNPNTTEDRATCSKLDKSDLSLKNEPASTSLEIPSKKKGTPGNSKRLRIDQEDSIQLKLTWLVAQELLRPPHKMPSIVHIEGHEFEEYQEAPTIGMPTFSATNQEGEKCQWIQCDDCSKWRKLPVDVLLLAKWTCSDNTWDPKRSSCSAAQELSMEELAGFLPMKTVSGPSKRTKVKKENDSVGVSDRLDKLANLAILGDGEEVPPSFQTTSKHPRHRLGCQCIVCIQPPSGKPKHSQTCTCNVCVTVKRRFRTLTLRREKRQSEKEADDARMHYQSTEISPSSKSNDDHESERGKPLPSPLKAQIDLNIQPERDEEPSPIATAASRARPFSNATS